MNYNENDFLSKNEACKRTIQSLNSKHKPKQLEAIDARIDDARNRIKKAIHDAINNGEDWCAVDVEDLHEWAPNYEDLFDELEKLGYSIDAITDIDDSTLSIFVFWDLDSYLRKGK